MLAKKCTVPCSFAVQSAIPIITLNTIETAGQCSPESLLAEIQDDSQWARLNFQSVRITKQCCRLTFVNVITRGRQTRESLLESNVGEFCRGFSCHLDYQSVQKAVFLKLYLRVNFVLKFKGKRLRRIFLNSLLTKG